MLLWMIIKIIILKSNGKAKRKSKTFDEIMLKFLNIYYKFFNEQTLKVSDFLHVIFNIFVHKIISIRIILKGVFNRN